MARAELPTLAQVADVSEFRHRILMQRPASLFVISKAVRGTWLGAGTHLRVGQIAEYERPMNYQFTGLSVAEQPTRGAAGSHYRRGDLPGSVHRLRRVSLNP
jgi:hypothetical protein